MTWAAAHWKLLHSNRNFSPWVSDNGQPRQPVSASATRSKTLPRRQRFASETDRRSPWKMLALGDHSRPTLTPKILGEHLYYKQGVHKSCPLANFELPSSYCNLLAAACVHNQTRFNLGTNCPSGSLKVSSVDLSRMPGRNTIWPLGAKARGNDKHRVEGAKD